MALLHLDFESEFLNANQDVYIIVPDKPRSFTAEEFYGSGRKYKVLWLLHGTFGGYSDWIRKSNIEVYACERDLIVVMPGVGNSDYENWENFTLGYDAHRYLTDELMPMIYGWLPASSKREDNFVAGLSMGGGGALKFALNHPDKFAGCGILSAAPRDVQAQKEQLEKLYTMDPETLKGTHNFGMDFRTYNRMHRYGSVDEYLAAYGNNNWQLLDAMVKDPMLPKLFFSVGTEDFGYEAFKTFKAHAEEIGLPAEFVTGPGQHEWRVWDRDIQKCLDFFGIPNKNAGNLF